MQPSACLPEPLQPGLGGSAALFLSGQQSPTRQQLQGVCRTLHLAFLNQSYDEVYNILIGMVIRAIDSYDPEYTAKVRQVVAAIASETVILGYRVADWPPKKSMLNSKPIGLTYHIQRQFRFILQA